MILKFLAPLATSIAAAAAVPASAVTVGDKKSLRGAKPSRKLIVDAKTRDVIDSIIRDPSSALDDLSSALGLELSEDGADTEVPMSMSMSMSMSLPMSMSMSLPMSSPCDGLASVCRRNDFSGKFCNFLKGCCTIDGILEQRCVSTGVMDGADHLLDQLEDFAEDKELSRFNRIGCKTPKAPKIIECNGRFGIDLPGDGFVGFNAGVEVDGMSGDSGIEGSVHLTTFGYVPPEGNHLEIGAGGMSGVGASGSTVLGSNGDLNIETKGAQLAGTVGGGTIGDASAYVGSGAYVEGSIDQDSVGADVGARVFGDTPAGDFDEGLEIGVDYAP